MEELQDPFLPERTRKGGSRSTCGYGARPASLAAAKMDDYTEIFGGFAASCSIPVLVLPEAMEGYWEPLLESQSMNYSEIFGDIDAGTFPLYYEELLSPGKGSKVGDDRFQEVPNGGQFENGIFELHQEVPIGDHIEISKVNQKSSTFHSSLNKISGRTSQKSMIDEVKSTICSSGLQANHGPDFEDDTASSIGFAEEDENPKTIESDDHILSGYMEKEEEKGGKEMDFLNTRFVGALLDGSDNDLKDDHKPSKYFTLESKSEDLKQHSRSSSYHSMSSGDGPFSDYSFLTISDINLHTQPLQVPPPSRAPPKLDMKQEMHKSELFEASNTTFSDELIPKTYKGYHGHHVGVRTRHALKETAKNNCPIYLNAEVDASSAAAASAAAVVEAMEQAQASLKSAKELMERNRENHQSGRKKDSHYLGSWNEQNISFAGRLRHITPKLAHKVVPNQVERANPFFSEDAEGAIQGKESRFNLLSDERERSHERKIDKQFYVLGGIDKLMRTRVISDEKYIREEATPNAYQFFPEKETYGTHRKIISHSDNDNNLEKLQKYRSEKILYPGGELEVQDRNAKNLKSGTTVENVEILDILETSDIPSLKRDDEDKQKVGKMFQVLDESKIKAENDISLIKHDRNEKELKECQESSICEAGKKNEDDNKELNSRGRNDSGLMDFYSDSKLEGFDGEVVGKTLGRGKEFDEIHRASIAFDHDALASDEHMVHSSKVFNYHSTSEFKKFVVKLSSLENASDAEVEKECVKSFSSDKEKNLEEMRDECQLGMLNKTIRETYITGYNEGKYSESKEIDYTSEKEIDEKFSETNKSSEPVQNEKNLKHEQSAKLNTHNRIVAKVGKVSVRSDLLANAKDDFKLQQNEEEKKEHKLPPKFENFVDKLTTDEEQRKGDKHIVVQAAFELEKKIKRLSACQQGLQRIRVQDDEVIQQANSLSPSVNASGSSLKQMEKSIPDEWRDANYIRKELSDSERKEAEQRRKLEEEREREREKDRIAVEKTSESCEKVFPESRERPERSEKSSAEVSEKSEKVANEAKLRAERAAVERATAEARERAIERALAEQASLGGRRQAEKLTNVSKEKSWKHNTSEGIVRPGEKDSEISLKPASVSEIFD
ncbi:hypothetical protein KSP40_PGU008519 [Platanthera guangdongensis]|uniref:Auxilin-like protein 1 n=1 Tax=Platanthera guangdongensis TaxID=2320717 RepID=A0ABR2LG63_9ASPA